MGGVPDTFLSIVKTVMNGHMPIGNRARRQHRGRPDAQPTASDVTFQTRVIPWPGKRLPIGTRDFETIRSEGFHHVDRTSLLRVLIDHSDHVFPARGVSARGLRALFEGRQELFRGLAIHDTGTGRTPSGPAPERCWRRTMRRAMLKEMSSNSWRVPGASMAWHLPGRLLRNLLDRLYAKSGQRVVILVDECDKPIRDVLDDPELACPNRDHLRRFHGIIKDSPLRPCHRDQPVLRSRQP